jgi:putative ABC transport system ATP-binding protein
MNVLELHDVRKEYAAGGRRFRVLDGVSLALADGEVVAVMGPSGAGKTTLLTISGALQSPTAGTVVLDGIAIGGLSEQERARVRRERVGFVFQSINLLQSLTALENVQYTLELAGHGGRHARARARELLLMVDLGHCADKLPAISAAASNSASPSRGRLQTGRSSFSPTNQRQAWTMPARLR